jgi:hypothetical protein
MRRVALGGLAVALMAAGCGGGDGTRLSRAELIKRGDAQCAALAREERRIGAFADVKALAAKGDRLLAADRAGLARFRRLRPPSDLQGAFDAYVGLVANALEVEAQYIDAARNRDVPSLRRLTLRQQGLRPRLAEAARRIGFQVCSQGGG